MSKLLSANIPGMLLDIPYCHLIQYVATGQYLIFYTIETEKDYEISDPVLKISGQIVHITIDLLFKPNAEKNIYQKSGQMELPIYVPGTKEPIIKVEVSGIKFPRVEPDQPQRSGTTTINYQDADED